MTTDTAGADMTLFKVESVRRPWWTLVSLGGFGFDKLNLPVERLLEVVRKVVCLDSEHVGRRRAVVVTDE